MAGEKSKSDSYCMCRDTATGEDSLGFQPYVEAIAEFLTADGTLAPITLSIEGQWGCGKSSFMQQLKKEISKKNKPGEETKYFTVWFNSWKYEKEDELWASFALNFMDELSKQLTWKRRQCSRLKLLYLRYKLRLKSDFLIIVHFSWNILSFVLIFSFLSLIIIYVLNYLGMPLPNFLDEELIRNFANLVLILTPLVGLINYFSTEKWFMDVFRDPFGLKKLESNTNYRERLSFREHFHSDFNEIIRSYVVDSKVYVFIDDLDRCEVPKAAELMQAINLMISDDSKVYFSLGMDRKVISAGLAAKNENVIRLLNVDGLEYGYDFIEKFIQLPFKVPRPKSANFLKFLTSSNENEFPSKPSKPLDKSGISEDSTPDKSPEGDFKHSQNENTGHETGTSNSSTVVTESHKPEVQNDKDCVEDSETSKLILEMVAPALDNNPRRMKQFFNLFRFQRTFGFKTGLFSDKKGPSSEYWWNCKKLAKFVAISIKWPSLIAALDSDMTLLGQLQDYAIRPEKEEARKKRLEEELKLKEKQETEGKLEEKEKTKKEEIKIPEKWTREKKLIELLREGCVEGGKLSDDYEKYTLSGLDFSKLLDISPEFTSSDSSPETVKSIEFVRIPAGEFVMGSPPNEQGRYDDEGPVHKVKIKNSFSMSKYHVTQKQWIAVMEFNPSQFKGKERPVENVSWNDVQEFIKRLNEMDGADRYRLPS